MKYAFLLYDSRSGSTLLSSLLNTFAGVVVTQESGFIPLILENLQDEKTLTVEAVLKIIYSEIQFCEWGIPKTILRARLNELATLNYKNIFDTIISEYLKIRGESDPELIIIKGPRHDIHLQSLIHIFQNPFFINLIRDGRAVYNSKLSMVSVTGMKMSDNIFQACFDWKKKLRRLADKDVIILRFEDLVADTAGSVDLLLDSMSISKVARAVTGTQQDYDKLIGKKQKHLHTNVKKDPDKSITVKWKKSLTDEEIWLYEYICRKELLDNGYDLIGRNDVSRVDVLMLIVRHSLHWCWLKLRNLFYYSFVDKSLIKKLKGMRFE